DGHRVTLNVYDLSQGLAKQLSVTFLGKTIEAIWHTGVVVYGNEYYFGGGIQHAPAGSTPYGSPIRVIELGITQVPQEVFEDFLQDISSRYTAETYRLLSHNCNNFSNEVAQFLVGTTIPDYILNLPNEVISSPMGPLILPMIQQLEATLRAGAVPQPPQFQPSLASRAQPSVPSTILVNPRKLASSEDKSGDSKISSHPQLPEQAKAVPAAAESIKLEKEKQQPPPASDPLGAARSKVQEEIMREFRAIMAAGDMHASEAAALATRRVMERYGRLDASAMQQA
ncbi:Desumoylating isopeptidase 1, partial [Ananas comosus]